MTRNLLSLDSIENTIRTNEFTRRVVAAANDHMRISEPIWDLYDVKIKTDTHAVEGRRIALTMYFKDNGLTI